MPIPKYDELTLPLLHLLTDGQERHLRDLSSVLADHFHLTEQERAAQLPNTPVNYLQNRLGWAAFYLKKAGLAAQTRASTFCITDAGREWLAHHPAEKINRAALMRLDPFRQYVTQLKRRDGDGAIAAKTTTDEETTPEERIEQASSELRASLSSGLLEQLAKMDPYRFEQLVLDLLSAMGYGGSREEAARVTQKSGDGGVDGVINEDRLGLDVIYVQAKRWQNTVGRNEIMNFVGALAGKHAQKGVFITTSDFNANATEYARSVSQKVILVNGPRLAELMIEHGIGVTTARTIAIKRIDSDYFEEA